MAILPEHARQWASRFTPDELAGQVHDRLLASTPVPLGHGKVEEFPEDVVIALLQDKAIAGEWRKAVARGWTQARYAVQVVLEPPELEPDDEKRQSLQEPFTRVFRVAELTSHPLLRNGVRSALPLVVATPSYATVRQVQQVVAAAIAYPDEVDRETWIRALHTREEIAAFAFRMLLVIDRHAASKITDHFTCLLERQFVDGWNLDVWFLGEYVRTAGMMEAIRQGIERFLTKHPEKWADVLLNCNGNPCWPNDVVQQFPRRQRDCIIHHLRVGFLRPVALDRFGIYDLGKGTTDELDRIECSEESTFKPEWSVYRNHPLLSELASQREYGEKAFGPGGRSNDPTHETIRYTKV